MKRLVRILAVLPLTLAAWGATGGLDLWSADLDASGADDPSAVNPQAEESTVTPQPDQVRLFNPYQRPKNGPPLTNVFHKAKLSWLGTKLKDPTYHPAARMPDFKFTEDEVTDVIAYLKSIAEEPSSPPVEWPTWARKEFEEVAESSEDLEAMLKQIESGKALWGNARCTICHTVGGPGGKLIGGFVDLRVGCIDLQISGTKLKRDWLYLWLKDPKSHFPDTLMPRFRFTDEQSMALVEYVLRDDTFLPPTEPEPQDPQREAALDDPQRIAAGKRLIETSRCVVCHEIQRIAEVFRLPERQTTPPGRGVEHLVYDLRCLSCHTIDGRGGTYAPDLTSAGSRLQEAWIPTFLESPDMIRLLSQQMPKLNLTADEAKTLASYLTASRRDEQIPEQIPSVLAAGGTSVLAAGGTSVLAAGGTAEPVAPTPEEIERGREAFQTKGCLSCHPVGEGEGGGVGPDLATIGDRLKPGYLWYHLKHPQAVNPYSAEPDYGLSDEEARVLAAYLSTKKKAKTADTTGLEKRDRSLFRRWHRLVMETHFQAREGLIPFLPSMVAVSLLGALAEGPTDEERAAGREEFINRRRQVQGAALTTREGLYLHYCAHCHGEQGKGDGRLWTTGPSRPASANLDLSTTQRDQAALVKFITEGSAASGGSNFCPPWGRTISPPNVQRLARYIGLLGGTASPAAGGTASPAAGGTASPAAGGTAEPPPPQAETQPAGAPFPWDLLGLILAEVGLLLWMVLRNRGSSHVVPENLAVR